MRHSRRTVSLAALVVLLVSLHTWQAHAKDDIGLPIHPQAISSTITRQTGKGEGTDWIIVNFKANAPYEEVVKYYRGKVEKQGQVQATKTESDKLMSTLILLIRNPKDQININISAEIGKKLTDVEILRNYIKP